MNVSPRQRIWFLFLGVLLVPILPWLLLGPWLEPWAAGFFAVDGQGGARGIVAVVGLLLLAGDSFLPVPSTLVMSALGYAAGVLLGGLAASLGLSLSGALAYGVCRRWGLPMARRLCGERGMARVETAMARHGPWLILATRSVPILQEASSCLAGVVRMPARLYFPALVAGCVPTGFAYAAIGASALQERGWAVGLSVGLPLATWPLIYLALRRPRGDGTVDTR